MKNQREPTTPVEPYLVFNDLLFYGHYSIGSCAQQDPIFHALNVSRCSLFYQEAGIKIKKTVLYLLNHKEGDLNLAHLLYSTISQYTNICNVT
jgi:hypothetical protein